MKVKDLFAALHMLKEHVTHKRFVELQDFLQLLSIVELLVLEEVLHLGYGETEAFTKGQELGEYFARSFVVKEDPIAHRMIGKFLAYGQGYKDMDTGFAFIEGFAKGMKDEPKQIQGRVHEEVPEL